MIFATKMPDEINQALYEFSDWFFQQPLDGNTKLRPKKLDTTFAVSDEYLREMKSRKDNVGYPEETYGVDFRIVENYNTHHFQERVMKLDNQLMTFTGSSNSALKMYYPPGGYIGWHNNANAPGYNILFTYSETGEGDFRYIHPLTGELILLPDKRGWSCKVGYYDVVEGRPLWHAAWTNCNRLNWAYIIHPLLWVDMAAELGIEVDAIATIIGKDPMHEAESYLR